MIPVRESLLFIGHFLHSRLSEIDVWAIDMQQLRRLGLVTDYGLPSLYGPFSMEDSRIQGQNRMGSIFKKQSVLPNTVQSQSSIRGVSKGGPTILSASAPSSSISGTFETS